VLKRLFELVQNYQIYSFTKLYSKVKVFGFWSIMCWINGQTSWIGGKKCKYHTRLVLVFIKSTYVKLNVLVGPAYTTLDRVNWRWISRSARW